MCRSQVATSRCGSCEGAYAGRMTKCARTRALRGLAWSLAAVGLAGVAACSDKAVLDGAITTFAISGTVRDAAGAPVAGATVRVEWLFSACGPQQAAMGDTTVTPATGVFTSHAWNWGTFHQACVRVATTAPPGSGLADGSLELGVALHPEVTPPETVTVAVVLPNAP
jgi:hypothetical protein